MAAFAIKVHVPVKTARTLVFEGQKTMYGGKSVRAGDVLFVFDSETGGGVGLWARGRVSAAEAVTRSLDPRRQTPRVDVELNDLTPAMRPLGRADLRVFRAWDDGQPQTELNFKFYRQATDKLVGLSPSAAAFLDGYLP